MFGEEYTIIMEIPILTISEEVDLCLLPSIRTAPGETVVVVAGGVATIGTIPTLVPTIGATRIMWLGEETTMLILGETTTSGEVTTTKWAEWEEWEVLSTRIPSILWQPDRNMRANKNRPLVKSIFNISKSLKKIKFLTLQWSLFSQNNQNWGNKILKWPIFWVPMNRHQFLILLISSNRQMIFQSKS